MKEKESENTSPSPVKVAITLGLIAITTLFSLVIIDLVISHSTSRTLGKDDSIRLTHSLSGYRIPKSTGFIYGKQYWVEKKAPSAVCTVFKLNESDFADFLKKDLPKVDLHPKEKALSGRGCREFREKLSSEEISSFEYISRQAHSPEEIVETIYINANSRIVIFEMYF